MFSVMKMAIHTTRMDTLRNKKIKKSLQAQVDMNKEHEASSTACMRLRQQKGSATVEAALVFPLFLCAICTVFMIAQFLLVEASVYHAMTQTTQIYAKQESCSTIKKSAEVKGDGTGLVSKLGGFLEMKVIFNRYLEKEHIPSSYVLGGREGIILQPDKENDSVKMKANYVLKVPVPFFSFVMLPRTLAVERRLFTGYVVHGKGANDKQGGDIVYVTEYGGVYHTHLDCYHINVTITDPKKIEDIMESKHYKKCEKCLRSGETPDMLLITASGDCYHASESCSGLKRTVVAVKQSELTHMRVCSECAKR